MKSPLLRTLVFALCAGPAAAQTDTAKAPASPNSATAPRIPVLAWGGPPEAETNAERYRELAEAGFTHNFSGFSSMASMTKALDIAQAAGIKQLVSIPELEKSPEEVAQKFREHPALGGYYLRDEPPASDFEKLGAWVKRIAKEDTLHLWYLNLFPNYATAEQLGTPTYPEYVAQFLAKIPVQIISFDHYPVVGDKLRPEWYENLEQVSSTAREAGKPFWAFALTVAHGPYPIPTLEQLRVQVFSNLAYGAQGIQYFTYWTSKSDTWNFHEGPINTDGKKTVVYDRVKQMNAEIRGLSPVFLYSKVLKVGHMPTVKDGLAAPLPRGTQPYAVSEPVKAIKCGPAGVLVSELANKEHRYLAIVNRDFLNAVPVTATFDGSAKIREFRKDGTTVEINGNEWNRDLAPGDIMVFTWEAPAPLNWTTKEDHENLKQQLGIMQLRPGPSGRPGQPNSANYDPAKANPYPDLPELLVLKNGHKVTKVEQWWKERRPEIVEDFEREVIGRVPKNTPKVKWTVVSTVPDGVVGELPVVGTQLNGHVDNSACPDIAVDIRMTLVTPAKSKGPVPVLMMFGGFGSGMPRRAGEPPPPPRPGFGGGPGAGPRSTEQLIAAGWGYATINPGSIQADNGAGLTKGIIGLVNKGQARKPDDWGSLRAWSWGAARGLDYLETNPAVDAKKVGIEGVSRFGKAALVTLAFEPRFAVALVGSSGEGGAKLHRRNFGEAVENLTGSGEYHWMAGNFLKYGAAESKTGSKNAGDLPVDAHQLIALCAPRPTFISYGVPEKGDANWLDQQGSYMATVAAGPVFRLLGVKDIGEKEDYRTAKMPPVNTGLLDGELAWRQHDGGHEDQSNMKYFIAWANKLLKHTPPSADK